MSRPAPSERPAGPHAEAPDPAVRVSVIVPAYNAAAFLRSCLRAIDDQTFEASGYEVIVVDDGSADDTADVALRFAADARATVRVLRMAANRGPAAARNAGLEAARGDVIAFTDSDCTPAADWLERGVAALDGEGDPAGVEGRTDPEGEVGTLTHQMRNESGGLYMTCNMLYRRAALDAAGGFDERFRLAFLEDSDVAFSVLESGGTITFDPTVQVRHLVLEEGRGKFWNEARKRYYNPLLYRKHPDSYRRLLRGVVPGFPRLHLQFMGLTVAPFLLWAAGLPGASVLMLGPWLVIARRIAHAYRARDPISIMQAVAVPFVQTAWVLRGAWRWRTFSTRL